jgi:Protein of unknown function (DUF3039)
MTTPQDTPDLDRGLGTLTEERTQPSYGDGDHERLAHYVQKDKVVDSAVTGTPLVALCGKVWVPSRDPARFPVCPECREIYESIRAREGGDAG